MDDDSGTNSGDTGGVACDSTSPGVATGDTGGNVGEVGASAELGRPGERVASSVLGLGHSAGGDSRAGEG